MPVVSIDHVSSYIESSNPPSGTTFVGSGTVGTHTDVLDVGSAVLKLRVEVAVIEISSESVVEDNNELNDVVSEVLHDDEASVVDVTDVLEVCSSDVLEDVVLGNSDVAEVDVEDSLKDSALLDIVLTGGCEELC